jgi:Tol biopolymer transport system component
MYITRSDGAGQPELLNDGKSNRIPASFSSDGSLLAFMEQTSKGFDVGVLTMADKKETAFAATPANERLPAISPDGRWIAYQSDESGRAEVYVRPYPGPGGKWQASVNIGEMPRWTKNGSEIVYISGPAQNRIMSVDVAATADALRISKPEALFDVTLARPTNATFFDVSTDGSPFVILRPENAVPVAVTHITLVFNFFSELEGALARSTK